MSPTKKKLLDNAVILFSEKGYDRVSIRELAKSVNIKESSVYNHFASKKDILNTVFDEFLQLCNRYYHNLDNISRSVTENSQPEEVLSKFLLIYSDADREFVYKVYRILFLEYFTNPRAKEIITEYTFEFPKRIIQYALEKFIEYGKISKIDADSVSTIWSKTVLATLFLNLHMVSLAEQQANRKAYVQSGRYIIDTILKGVVQ